MPADWYGFIVPVGIIAVAVLVSVFMRGKRLIGGAKLCQRCNFSEIRKSAIYCSRCGKPFVAFVLSRDDYDRLGKGELYLSSDLKVRRKQATESRR